MPPKRKASQSASQPMPQTAKSGRPTRKQRAGSEASNISDRPPSSQADHPKAAAPARKRKGRAAAENVETVAIAEEDEEELVQHHAHTMQHGGDATDERMPLIDSQGSVDVSHPRSKHVRFGGSPAEMDEEDAPSTAANITPHPRKLSLKRRFTISPSLDHATPMSKRIRISTGPGTAPSGLRREGSSQIIKELQYEPLDKVLADRKRQRIEAEQKAGSDGRSQLHVKLLREETLAKQRRITVLETELEEQKHSAIEVDDDGDAQQAVISSQQQLEEARLDLEAHLARHGLHAMGQVPDTHMLVLGSQDEIEVAEEPEEELSAVDTNGTYARGTVKFDLPEITESTGRLSTALAEQTAAWQKERKEFQDAILALSKEATEAQAQLRIWRIEISSLGYGNDGADAYAILSSIRDSMSMVREKIKAVLPDTLPEGATNEEIIEILVGNLESFASQLRRQSSDVRDKEVVIADLTAQIDGLLEHLTEARLRYERLEEQWRNLDLQNDNKARLIEELEEQLETLTEERDRLQDELNREAEQEKILEADNAEKAKDVEKLQASLERYMSEETRLSELITRMETEHGDLISKMNREREEMIVEYDKNLENEAGLRLEAEKQSDERQTIITELEVRIEQISTERDDLRAELDVVKAERDTEIEGRQQAEATLEEKNIEIEDLETRVDRLEEELTTLNEQLEELRRNNEHVRAQLTTTEQDLDDRNVEVEELTRRLEEQGKEANELRMKLFQVQQDNQARVSDLEEQMSDRDEQYQRDIAAEVVRRETSEELAQQRAATISDLEARIEEIELQMRADIALRDERIVKLEEDVVDTKTLLEQEQMDHRATQNRRDDERTEYEEKVEELKAVILALENKRDELEARIQELAADAQAATDLHNSEIDDRNAEIARLHGEMVELETKVQSLCADRDSLERRVEQEATAMLQLQNAKEDEIDDLKAQLKDKQAKIIVVEEKAREADDRWQEVLDARDQQIADLLSEGQTSETVITQLTTVVGDWKRKFRELHDAAAARIGNLRDELERARAAGEREASAFDAEGLAILEEVEGFNVETLLEVRKTVTTSSTTTAARRVEASASNQQTPARKGRGKKGKRFGDSGIGMQDGEVDEVVAV